MDSHIKNYFDYLFYIGITCENTYSSIRQILSNEYNNSSNEDSSINDILSGLTGDYLKLLNKEQLELIGKNIYEQYMINKSISEIKIIKKLLILRNNYFKRKKKKYLNKWRLSTINSDINVQVILNKSNSGKNIKSRSNSKRNIFNSKKFLDKLEYYNDKKKEKNDKIKLFSESNILNECTFHPNLKLSFLRNNSIKKLKANFDNNFSNNKSKKKLNEFHLLKNIIDDNINKYHTKKIGINKKINCFQKKINSSRGNSNKKNNINLIREKNQKSPKNKKTKKI